MSRAIRKAIACRFASMCQVGCLDLCDAKVSSNTWTEERKVPILKLPKKAPCRAKTDTEGGVEYCHGKALHRPKGKSQGKLEAKVIES